MGMLPPSPAKAGAQLRSADWLRVPFDKYNHTNWAPACAGEGTVAK
jgi:hypothetical protein